MYLLEPEEFNKCYTFLEYDTPRGDKQKQFCEEYLKLKHKAKKTDEDAAIRAYTKTYVIKSKSEDKIKNEALDLYRSLKRYLIYLEAQEQYKEVLNRTTLTFLKEALYQVQNHKLAKDLLFTLKSDETNDIDDFNEFQITWKHPMLESVNCVSTLDRLIIDHNMQVIILVDLKTTSKLSEFASSFESFKYYRQLAFYWMAIEYFFKEKYPEKNINDYIRKSYIIAIQTTTNTYTSGLLTECEVFDIKDEWLDAGADEIDLYLEKINWHFENDLWDHSREYYEGNGSIILK
jgi:hypothetical protein